MIPIETLDLSILFPDMFWKDDLFSVKEVKCLLRFCKSTILACIVYLKVVVI